MHRQDIAILERPGVNHRRHERLRSTLTSPQRTSYNKPASVNCLDCLSSGFTECGVLRGSPTIQVRLITQLESADRRIAFEFRCLRFCERRICNWAGRSVQDGHHLQASRLTRGNHLVEWNLIAGSGIGAEILGTAIFPQVDFCASKMLVFQQMLKY